MVIMPKRRNRFSDYITAFGANLMSGSGIGTGRIFISYPFTVGMTSRRDLFISGIAASRTGVIGFISALLTGGWLTIMMYKVMT